ncbi:hypothetical protein Tsubulata_004384 [Turnera subulata]|uniref:Transcription factor CBF/NF-Y/archaeal histone domain-containing protein n=1 Tax=Turnera subulata TaxID=218843 RepID=A0A9Q0J5S6_9ROSI|nr:hypothetical protein Tsubulata_004384 [Turnera subulata]
MKIMRKILPHHAKISDDAKETVQECVSEYISFITGEANERCQREQRKTITAEDVLWAMGKLGFDDYVEPLSVFLARYRESENSSSVRDHILKRNAMEYAAAAGGGGHHQRMVMPAGYSPVVQYPVAAMGVHHDHNNQVAAAYDPAMLAGYYRDGGGSSSSQNAQASYDPYGHQFK